MTTATELSNSMEFAYDPQHLGEDVRLLFSGATSAVVVAPFITKSGLLPLIAALAPGGRLDVVTRWEPIEVSAGVSDPMIIDDVEATGGRVRLVTHLHSKVYLVGERALVGSANATGPGLGFTTRSNIETLVLADSGHTAITRLFATIDGIASSADRDYAVQLVDYASTLPKAATMAVFNRTAESAIWIPHTTVAKRVLECYAGIVPDRTDYRADLAAIAAPTDLSQELFRTHVALMLRQGLIGRIYQECEGLQQFAGIQHMLQLLAGVGIETVEDPTTIWRRILNWFEYYLQASDSLNGGYSAKR